MDSLKEIIEKIEEPLLFSSKDSYKYLPLVKNLEITILNFSRQLRAVINMYEEQDLGQSIFRQTIDAFDNTFAGFDNLSLQDKIKRLEKGNLILYKLKESAETVLHNTFEMRSQTEVPEIRDVRFSFEKLALPVRFIKGVGPKISALLEKKGLRSVEDMLYFVPRRYEDRRYVSDIKSVTYGSRATVIGNIVKADTKIYGHKRVFEVTIDDGSGLLTAKWFKGNNLYLKRIFKNGMKVIMSGEVSSYLFSKDIVHPDFEIMDDKEDGDESLLHFKRIVPVYSETEGLHQKYIRKIMSQVIDRYVQYIVSPIPMEICEKRHLYNIQDALRNVHFPTKNEKVEAYNEMQSWAHRRLIYDEFFFLQLGIALKRKGNMLDKGVSFNVGGKISQIFFKILPYKLTNAQKRVLDEINADMEKTSSMNRLLQGDVGSGKTVVAMAAMVTACENGYQAAIMAPTEILAEQHYNVINNWAGQLGFNVVLLTSGIKSKVRKEIYSKIEKNDVHIIVGTHALIQETVKFAKLGLVVVDEQHRFGVIQRASLRQKGLNPDVLVMTATPIPRTLAMTVYGDLDVSVIDEFPPGRKEIKTKVFVEGQRNRVYEIIRGEIIKKNQVFIVYPLVEESENTDMKDATKMADHLQKDIFPDFKVGLVHGRMKSKEKEEVMIGFLNKEIDILVSTTVIEVGIDIPQASLMVIEHAERFGLSQLHQLRGRVGRSDIPSYCILMSNYKGSEDSKKRLNVMEDTNDGFKIAEEDLAIRGPGEFMGIRQSGLPDFRIANILRDTHILGEAKTDAFALIKTDPLLEKQEHAHLKEVLLHRWGGRLELAKTG